MLERIAKLLAQAEGASNTNEAEAYFAKAQELASRHAIDLELARRAAAPKEREKPVRRHILVGERGKRANKPLINLFLGIAASNDVKVYIANNSTFVDAFGVPSDLDATEALWTSLAATMVRFGNAHIADKNAAWRTETVWVEGRGYWDEGERKPISGQSARRSFYDGYTSRISQRLRLARKEAIAAADAEAASHFHEAEEPVAELAAGTANLPSSMALVLKEKYSEVEQYALDDYKRRWGRAPRGSWRGSSGGSHSGSSHSAGRAAADRTPLSSTKAIAS